MDEIEKIFEADPAPYPPNTEEEIDAVRTFNWLVDLRFVKPITNFLDKIPNTDGIVEITDKNRIPKGKLEVQIKKLTDRNINSPKYQCSQPFLAYCEHSVNPVLLIVVDTKNSKAYWKHIDVDTLKDLKSRIKNETISVEFSITNCIEKTKSDYVDEWIKIIESYKLKIFNYKNIEENLKKYQIDFESLSKLTNKSIGLQKAEYREIHIFLDFLNNALDYEFNIVKQIYYPNLWKMGLGFSEYNEDSSVFAFFPIEFGKSDLLIKEFDKINLFDFNSDFLEVVWTGATNPIKNAPLNYVNNFMYEHIKNILKNRVIRFSNDFIANEFIIAFIDRNYKFLGLEKGQKKYKLSDIKEGMDIFFPLLYEEGNNIKDTIKAKNIQEKLTYSSEVHYALPAEYFPYEEKFDELSRKIKELIKNGTKPLIEVDIIDNIYDIDYLKQLIEYLEKQGKESAVMVYPKELPINKTSYAMCEKYNGQIAKEKLEIFYKNLPILFNQALEIFFPKQKDDIRLFDDFNRLIIVLQVKEKDGRIDSSLIKNYFFKNLNNPNENKIEIFLEGKDEIPLPKELIEVSSLKERKVKIENDNYEVFKITFNHSMFLYKELMMQNYLYKLLEERFDDFFKKRIDK